MALGVADWALIISPFVIGGMDPLSLDYTVFVAVWLGFTAGTIGQPHMMQRFQAVGDERMLSEGVVIMIFFEAIRGVFGIFIGLAGYVLIDNVANPENIGVILTLDLFPAWLAGIILAGVVSAILSTSDSMCLLTSAELTRVYQEWVKPDASDRHLAWIGRLFVVIFMLFAIAVALIQLGTIFELVTFGWSGLGAGLGVTLFFVLFWKRTTSWGIVAGMIVALISTFINQIYWPDLFPILVFPVTIAAIISGSYVASAETRGVWQPAPSEPGE